MQPLPDVPFALAHGYLSNKHISSSPKNALRANFVLFPLNSLCCPHVFLIYSPRDGVVYESCHKHQTFAGLYPSNMQKDSGHSYYTTTSVVCLCI